jgi:hypothetical protein
MPQQVAQPDGQTCERFAAGARTAGRRLPYRATRQMLLGNGSEHEYEEGKQRIKNKHKKNDFAKKKGKKKEIDFLFVHLVSTHSQHEKWNVGTHM